jgi:NAD(P)-dependent dehydrogenase (short-subunit alcohol dehydrogenase family)
MRRTDVPSLIPRRRMLARSGAAVAAALGAGAASCRRATESAPEPRRPPGVPLSAFGPSSTAEEVTAGLDLRGRTALVTGATSGLGLETVRVLALRGAHVIVTGRTLDRAAAACAAVAPDRSTPLALELGDWAGVVKAAAVVRSLDRPLDVLICNAGLMHPPALTLVHGVEEQFAVNHLGHFVLCHHLLDLVRAAPQGRIVVVSSALMSRAPAGRIDFGNLDGAHGYDAAVMYGQSKLANALFAFELARRTAATSVTVNTLHPGVSNTNLDRANPAWRRWASRALSWNRPWVKSIEAAAATQTYLATAPALATVTGCYFEDCNPVVLDNPHTRDLALAARLWDTSLALTRPYVS